MQINPQIGLSFANGLRAILRQDPNIIMVGEIRDQETANIAIRAALTGHLVFQPYIQIVHQVQSSAFWTWGLSLIF